MVHTMHQTTGWLLHLLVVICLSVLTLYLGALALLTNGGYLASVTPLCTEGQHKGLQKDW